MSMRSVSVFLAAATSATADEVSVKVNVADPTTVGIPSDFASLSAEPFCATPYFANKDYTPRKQFVNLMKNLHTTSNGPKGPNIRLGGGSSQISLYNWPASDMPFHNITTQDVKAFSYADMWSGSITLDVQINSTSEILENTKEYVGEVLRQLGPVLEAFEIGNEPSLQDKSDWDTYVTEWETVAEVIRRVQEATNSTNPQPRIQGGTVQPCPPFDAHLLPEYLKNFTDGPSRNYLKSLSHHFYRECGARGNQTELMDELLFKDGKYTRSVSSLKELVVKSLEAGVTFNIGEGNSHNSGGIVNVSNTFGSALWAVDSMLEAASLNISRWNFHGCPGPIPVGPHLSRTDTMAYSPIMSSTSNPDVLEARPLYYGMWLFTALTALDSAKNQARMLELEYVKSTNELVRVWATGTPQVARFVAIHKDYKQTDLATVRIDVGAARAGRTVTVKRMYPKSKDVFSTYGINFAGQTLDGTTDGIPIGTPTHETATVGPDGSLTLSVDPVSMVLAELEL